MDIPEPYNYNTKTFDPDEALNHVLQYPAFANALTNHQDGLYSYLGMSKIITDLMKDSFQARLLYQDQKTLYRLRSKVALRIARYAALLGLVLFAASFLSPLAASQTLIWALLGIGAGLFIALPLSLTICMGRKAHEKAEDQLQDIHDIEIWIREFYANTHLADIQDGMLAGIQSVNNDFTLKAKALH